MPRNLSKRRSGSRHGPEVWEGASLAHMFERQSGRKQVDKREPELQKLTEERRKPQLESWH